MGLKMDKTDTSISKANIVNHDTYYTKKTQRTNHILNTLDLDGNTLTLAFSFVEISLNMSLDFLTGNTSSTRVLMYFGVFDILSP